MFVDVLTRTTGDAGKVLQFALMEVLTRTNGDAGKVLQFVLMEVLTRTNGDCWQSTTIREVFGGVYLLPVRGFMYMKAWTDDN
jgi:hypothetical protein